MALAAVLRDQAVADPQVASAPAPIREALAFARVLAGLPIGLVPGESLAGDCGWQFASPARQTGLAELLASRPAGPPGEPTPLQLLDQRFHCNAGYTVAHTLLDYERVVTEGLAGILQEVRAHQAAATGARGEYVQAMEVALEAVVRFAARHAGAAREAAGQVETEPERDRLLRMAKACDRAPHHPATTFLEGLQAIWLMHLAVGFSEYSDASLSLGRLDQYLYPLYCADLQRGVSREALGGLLGDLWRKLNRFGDPACAVNLGGLSEAGRDMYNPLSSLIIEVSRSLRLPAPILAARIHDQVPPFIFDALLDPALLTVGQPTLYGELPCREAMRRRGVPEGVVHGFALNSCMGLVMPGEEISDMWGVVANLLLPLELALNAGSSFSHELPVVLGTPPQAAYDGFDDLYDQFARYLDELLDVLVAANAEATAWFAAERPNPLLSALTRDCVARGLDRADGGPRYHSVIVEGFGWANAADALTAIRHRVFEEHAYTLQELVTAAREDFAGHEDLRRELLRAPKYGNGDPEADEMAARVSATFAGLVSKHSTGRTEGRPGGNRYYLPSYHSLNAHIGAGSRTAASLDGRHAGEPLTKNAGPMTGRAREGLTGVLLSASAIPQTDMSGGQALDISLQPQQVATIEGKRALQALLLTYFQRGGLQVQMNGLSPEELRAAIAEPGKHRDLIVRIAGYSAQFVSLSREVQEEMVTRFEQGL
jgi:formate C-acetyltransferase